MKLPEGEVDVALQDLTPTLLERFPERRGVGKPWSVTGH